MAAIKNDGTVTYAGVVLTIAAVAYVADKLSVKRPTKTLEQRNELDEPSGQVSIVDFVTGSTTLQLATPTTRIPQLGDEFPITLDPIIGSETFFIDSRDDMRDVGELRKIPVTFRKKYN